MRVGLVVNPIAGMGGRVGLKGTDGKVAEARERGAEPRAPERAVRALEALYERSPESSILTWGGKMGADEAERAGVPVEVLGQPAASETSAADTRRAVRAFVDAGADIILFVGGDGTAVDVHTALTELEANIPMLGVPGGVKVYSSVFAVTPETAGRIAASFDRVEGREINDIDESAYRDGEVRATLKGVASVPVSEGLQGSKQTHAGTVEGLAAGIADETDPDVTYVLGPGGTLGAIKSALGFAGSSLGVDVWRDGRVLVRDGSEREILDSLGEQTDVIVSPVGGQGFVLGRGNDQISPAVLRESRLRVVASRTKLDEVGVLRVDTGDPELDDELRGWRRVRVGRFEHRMMKIV